MNISVLGISENYSCYDNKERIIKTNGIFAPSNQVLLYLGIIVHIKRMCIF